MNTPRRPLLAVPEPGESAAVTVCQAGSGSRQDNTPITKEDDVMITSTDEDQAWSAAELRRQRVGGAWVDLGCTAFALVVDLMFIAAGVYFFHNGFLPGWLDGHGGVWAWFGAGAVACWWVLVETPHAMSQLNGAYWQLYSDRLDARLAESLGEGWARR